MGEGVLDYQTYVGLERSRAKSDGEGQTQAVLARPLQKPALHHSVARVGHIDFRIQVRGRLREI